MNEIEIKLSFPSASEDIVLRELTTLLEKKGNSRGLSNTYYDTPELSLRKSRWALRVRDMGGGRYEQTVKGMGKAQAGLHQRIEHNWPISSKALDLGLLKKVSEFPAENVRKVQPVFLTDFVRTAWKIESASAQNDALVGMGNDDFQIEIACDLGVIKVDGRQDSPISEIELELLHGQVESLISVGKRLVESIPCWLYTPSKAARGYGLLAGGCGFNSSEINSIATLSNWVDVMGRFVQKLANVTPGSVEISDFSLLIEVLEKKVLEANFAGDPWDELIVESRALAKINGLEELAHKMSRSTWLGRAGMAILSASLGNE
ncbi:hypothetical protein BTA51_00550 [Hahella sp. CCB-MM4]|uniref:CYTH domain-containing protein n=1 Tax=Hahella sp. (strain CCB-MM4) TaxID=1926491 RepID=UPI000B9BD21F|nr:CYTH domain-containing protein [Hahella sp. CCB-MM4]OZG74929.1 hypothetical protein BTA51_00550 [Hahella sp. CCB-MM4]